MKNILFLLSDLERGGIPRVTLNLLAELDYRRVSADVFCGNPRGIFFETLKGVPETKLLDKSLLLQAIMSNYRKERDWFKFYALGVKLIRVLVRKIFRIDILQVVESRIGKMLSENHYDVVFACSEGLPADIVLKITAKKRCVWIHNDYDHDTSINTPGLLQKLKGFDTIICVAEHARISICEHFPELSAKAKTVYNIANMREIQERANDLTAAQCFSDDDKVKIVSVGRFYEFQKNFSVIPQICAELKKRGVVFRWYLIGNGSPAETQILLDAVKKYEAGDTFVVLGEKSNPYPYLKNADLFVLTSRYETYPTVINEAKALGTPVISTDFKGADEVVDREDGLVVPIDQFADTIERFCKNKLKRKICFDFSCHNETVLKQIYQIIEG